MWAWARGAGLAPGAGASTSPGEGAGVGGRLRCQEGTSICQACHTCAPRPALCVAEGGIALRTWRSALCLPGPPAPTPGSLCPPACLGASGEGRGCGAWGGDEAASAHACQARRHRTRVHDAHVRTAHACPLRRAGDARRHGNSIRRRGAWPVPSHPVRSWEASPERLRLPAPPPRPSPVCAAGLPGPRWKGKRKSSLLPRLPELTRMTLMGLERSPMLAPP